MTFFSDLKPIVGTIGLPDKLNQSGVDDDEERPYIAD